MKLKLLQNSVGIYNLFGSEKSISFSLALVDDDNKVIEEDGHNAILRYGGEVDEDIKQHLDDWKYSLEEVFNICYKYSSRVSSSTNYEAQCLLFAKLYNENYDYINDQMEQIERGLLQKQLEEIQEKLSKPTRYVIPDLSHQTNYNFNQDITKYEKWLQNEQEKLKDFKEDSDSYKDSLAKIEKYQTKIDKYKKYLV